MTKLDLIIIHLLHHMQIIKSHILADDFVESFNISIQNPSFDEKTKSLDYLLKNGYIQIDETGYIGLTQKGGQFWESTFLIDWHLYFEYGSQFKNDTEFTFFYATNKETVQLAIKNSNGLFDDCEIKITQDWQAIYWKPAFNGFYIEKALDSELLPYFDEILPKYCKDYPLE